MIKITNKIIIQIIFSTLILTLHSCILFQPAEKSDILLPGETETPGWKIDGRVNEFTPDNIQEYANEPDKSLLHAYGFRELFIGKYRNISNENKKLTIEIYLLNSDINAFGVFSMKRTADSQENKIFMDSYSAEQTLFSRKENYFIKIISVTEYPDSYKDREEFLSIICDKIKKDNPLPDYLSLFEKYEQTKSLVYRVNGYTDLPMLKNIFTRKINISDSNKIVFFAKRNSSYNLMNEFSGIINNKSMNFILSGAGDSQTAFLKIDDNKYIYLSIFKEWIFGTFDAGNMAEGEKITGLLFSDLKQYLAKH